MLGSVKVGDRGRLPELHGAVIDKRAFDKIKGYIDGPRRRAAWQVLFGGDCDDTEGLLHPADAAAGRRPPTIRTMCEEIFGPVLTLHVYPEKQWTETLQLVDTARRPTRSPAPCSRRIAPRVAEAQRVLRYAAGNFYINDKRPVRWWASSRSGGARASGTNDKAGSLFNLIRWTSPRTIKENFVPPRDFTYPFMASSESGGGRRPPADLAVGAGRRIRPAHRGDSDRRARSP